MTLFSYVKNMLYNNMLMYIIIMHQKIILYYLHQNVYMFVNMRKIVLIFLDISVNIGQYYGFVLL